MNIFEDKIIEAAIKSGGKVSDVFLVVDQFLNDRNYCKGSKDITLKGDGGSKVDVLFTELLDTYYFISDFSSSDGDKRIQISSLKEGHNVHLIYSSFLRDTPLLTIMFNDLGITQHKANLVNYAGMLAENGLYIYKNWFEEVVLCSPQTSDWYYQRCMVAAILNDFIKNDSNTKLLLEKRIPIDNEDSFYIINFRSEEENYYWIDYLTDDNVNVSHLEKLNGKKVEILFASDSKQRYFIPQNSVKAILPVIYNYL